jgi:hypothetical protein
MPVSSCHAFLIAMIFNFLLVTAHSQDATQQKTILEAGKLIIEDDSQGLLKHIQTEKTLENSLRRDLLNVAFFIASVYADESTLSDAKGLASSDQGFRESVEFFAKVEEMDLEKSEPVNLLQFPVSEVLAVKSIYQTAIRNAISGKPSTDGISNEIDALQGMQEQARRFVESCNTLAPYFTTSQVGLCVAMADAANARESRNAFKKMDFLADLKSKPVAEWNSILQSRGEGTAPINAEVELMKSRMENAPKLVEAYSKLYESYCKGELTRVQCIQGMQQVASTSMDLQEKRVNLYWTLKKLRQEQLKAEAENRRESFAKRRSLEEKRTAASLSANWPTLFTHKKLKADAAKLRSDLATYSEQNSGLLSTCFAKCEADVKLLQASLQVPMDGITSAQRSMLSLYLSKILDELQKPYEPEGYITQINSSKSNETQLATKADATATTAVAMISNPLTKGDKEVASYLLCRAFVSEILLANDVADKDRLTKVAKQIRDSKLLTEEHRKLINTLGSQAFKGDLKGVNGDVVSLEDVLKSFSGMSYDTVNKLKLDDAYSQEAFEILLSSQFDG